VNSTEKNLTWVLAGLAGAAVLYYGVLKPKPVIVKPVAPLCPGPDCPKPPKKPDRRPWATPPAARAVAFACVRPTVGDPEPMVDLLAVPGRKHNISAKGAGCCTFRTMDYAGMHQNVPAIVGLPEWLKSAGFAGGGTPSKEADMIAKCAAARNMPCPDFYQYEGNDPWFIESMLASGRSVGITWQSNHMLSCVHLDAQTGAIVDNNAPDKVQFFPRDTFLKKWTVGGGGWAIALLAPPPAPPPSNLRPPVKSSLPCGKDACTCGCGDGEPCRCAAGVLDFRKTCPCSKDCTCGCNEGKKCSCCPEEEAQVEDGGLEWVYEGRERYTFGASMKDTSRQEVESWLKADGAKLHLTVIGDEPSRKAALDSLGADAGRYLVQSYGADNWALQCGFAFGPLVQAIEGGQLAPPVTVYLQGRDGKVLLRSANPLGLAEKLRRADPTYQPTADPSGDGVAGVLDQAKQFVTDNPALSLGGAGAAALYLLYRRSKGGPAAAVAPAQRPAPAASQAPAVAPGTLATSADVQQLREMIRQVALALPNQPRPS
jgi:hypothetical protein